MNKSEIIAILVPWHVAMVECDRRMDELSTLTGGVVESPLGNAVYGLMESYTKSISERIGWDRDTLEAWWCEYNFGEKPMSAGFSGKPMRTISTIEELAQFIADDHARRECP